MSMSSTRLSHAEDEDGQLFKVTLTKEKSGVFGFAYRVTDVDGTVVTAIFSGTPADDYNMACDPDDMICVGDRIQDVNGSTIDEDFVDQLQTQTTCKVTFMRTGPRWHLVRGKAYAKESNQDRSITFLKLSEAAKKSEMSVNEVSSNLGNQVRVMRPSEYVLVFLAVLIPNVVQCLLLSDFGAGIKFYSALTDAKSDYNFYGNGIISIGFCCGIFMYVLDWTKWKKGPVKILSAVAIVYGVVIGFILKSKFYPQVPIIMCLFHLPAMLGFYRVSIMKHASRKTFYIAVSASCFVVAFLVLGTWLVWMNVEAWDGINQYNAETKAQLVEDCKGIYDSWLVEINGRERSLVYDWDCAETGKATTDLDWEHYQETGNMVSSGHKLTSVERKDRSSSCGKAKTAWFFVWMAPFICSSVDMICMVFCLINGVWLDTEDLGKLEQMLKNFILMLGMMTLAGYVSVSIAGASMRLTSTILAFCGSGVLCLFAWLYLEIGSKALTSQMTNSRIFKALMKALTSDWVRAMMFILCCPFIPAAAIINMMNQKMRRFRGLTKSSGYFTEAGTKAIHFLKRWNWSNIFIKANLIGMVYWTMTIGVAKITYVFLSWLNQTLLQVDLLVVVVIFFVVGFTMFLLPPVPGIPVYICSGIVISARATPVEGVGFWGGVCIAIFLSYILKLAAVCGQYMIGFYMGKSVKIQQLCMLDKVGTRAIEMILKTKGLNLPKVSVLIGAPDWPCSVLCGIIRLNLFQCVLGTTPVILVSSPCVLAGAFMSGTSQGDKVESESITSTLGTTMLGISALGQLASAVLAMYYTTEAVTKHGEMLSQPRPEHEPIVALTRKEEEYNQALVTVTDLSVLSKRNAATIMTSTALFGSSVAIFMFMDEACFRPFQIKSRINDDYAEEGLNGNAFNIVKPIGVGASIMFFTACLLHVWYERTMGKIAKEYLEYKNMEAHFACRARSSSISDPGAIPNLLQLKR